MSGRPADRVFHLRSAAPNSQASLHRLLSAGHCAGRRGDDAGWTGLAWLSPWTTCSLLGRHTQAGDRAGAGVIGSRRRPTAAAPKKKGGVLQAVVKGDLCELGPRMRREPAPGRAGWQVPQAGQALHVPRGGGGRRGEAAEAGLGGLSGQGLPRDTGLFLKSGRRPRGLLPGCCFKLNLYVGSGSCGGRSRVSGGSVLCWLYPSRVYRVREAQ